MIEKHLKMHGWFIPYLSPRSGTGPRGLKERTDIHTHTHCTWHLNTQGAREIESETIEFL